MISRELSPAHRDDDEEDPIADGGTIPQGVVPKDGPQIGDTYQTRTTDRQELLNRNQTSTSNGNEVSSQQNIVDPDDKATAFPSVCREKPDDGAVDNGSNDKGRDVGRAPDDAPLRTAEIDPARIYEQVLAEFRQNSCFWTQFVRCYKGASLDDALHNVMLELLKALANNMTLRSGEKLPQTERGIVRHCVRRVRHSLSAPRKGATRQKKLRDERKDDIIDMQLVTGGAIADHPFFDRDFRIELLDRAKKDPSLHKLIHVLMSCEYLPGTPDLESGQHTRLAEYMKMTPSELRNAARRLDTLKNKLIEERNGRDKG